MYFTLHDLKTFHFIFLKFNSVFPKKKIRTARDKNMKYNFDTYVYIHKSHKSLISSCMRKERKAVIDLSGKNVQCMEIKVQFFKV